LSHGGIFDHDLSHGRLTLSAFWIVVGMLLSVFWPGSSNCLLSSCRPKRQPCRIDSTNIFFFADHPQNGLLHAPAVASVLKFWETPLIHVSGRVSIRN
jgi:hypothetical protein